MYLTRSEMLKDKGQTQGENQLLVSWVTKPFPLVTRVFSSLGDVQAGTA